MNDRFAQILYLAARFVLAAAILSLANLESRAQDEGQDDSQPKEIELVTTDTVKLKCTFYPGRNEKETIPVILLHRWEFERESMIDMAGYLQSKYGHAVIVPDLRGHGKSVYVVDSSIKLDRDRWRTEEVAAMVEDIEACKKFLVQKNNEGELNIDLLSVVAHGESAIHAVAWTLRDWSYPDLGGIKQGRDVKALVLIEPERSFKGLNATDGLKHPLFTGRTPQNLPVMIAASSRDSREARKINDALKRGRRSREKDYDDQLNYVTFDVENMQMVVKSRKEGTRPLSQLIGEFIKKHVDDRKGEFRWQDRSGN